MKKKEYLQPQILLLYGEPLGMLLVKSYAIGTEEGQPGPSISIEEDPTDPDGTGVNDDDFVDID